MKTIFLVCVLVVVTTCWFSAEATPIQPQPGEGPPKGGPVDGPKGIAAGDRNVFSFGGGGGGKGGGGGPHG
ncbi:hypothetical protein MTP99_017417 [Tenebrio molitor]|nr:hypothetical protein MTP99_017417 [Tenebrio molitor]CAH1376038.1 unnamed protein product [Tenebrio molitor]